MVKPWAAVTSELNSLEALGRDRHRAQISDCKSITGGAGLGDPAGRLHTNQWLNPLGPLPWKQSDAWGQMALSPVTLTTDSLRPRPSGLC